LDNRIPEHDTPHRQLTERAALAFVAALAVTGLLWVVQEGSYRDRLRLETVVTAEQAGMRLSDWIEDRMNLSSYLAKK
jgi:hypothetical protein